MIMNFSFKKIKELLFFILIPIIPAFIISYFTNSGNTFDTITKPTLTPPRIYISNCMDYSIYLNGYF